jgi:U3 small nucleolar RNA-associated protein 12
MISRSASGRNSTSRCFFFFHSVTFLFVLICSVRHSQLFLEEERERELENIYESGIADTLNRGDALVGSGVGDGPGDATQAAEATGVTKQTTETLMAGERIMEAIDLADAERALFRDYEEAMSRLAGDAMRLAPPPRNAVLAAYDLEPEAWVLRVVERVQSTALQDALLVLPFGKVISLMGYLNIWAQRVRPRRCGYHCR